MFNTYPLAHFHTPQLSHSLFRSNFTITSGIYKRLGQFDYGQPHCITDHISICFGKDNEWIYIGEVREGSYDIPHGIGIQVYDSGGSTQQLNYKDY